MHSNNPLPDHAIAGNPDHPIRRTLPERKIAALFDDDMRNIMNNDLFLKKRSSELINPIRAIPHTITLFNDHSVLFRKHAVLIKSDCENEFYLQLLVHLLYLEKIITNLWLVQMMKSCDKTIERSVSSMHRTMNLLAWSSKINYEAFKRLDVDDDTLDLFKSDPASEKEYARLLKFTEDYMNDDNAGPFPTSIFTQIMWTVITEFEGKWETKIVFDAFSSLIVRGESDDRFPFVCDIMRENAGIRERKITEDQNKLVNNLCSLDKIKQSSSAKSMDPRNSSDIDEQTTFEIRDTINAQTGMNDEKNYNEESTKVGKVNIPSVFL